jgi:phosphoheptose isomerase
MTAPYLDSMRLDERYADAAARAESLSNQLADLRDVFESLGLTNYADVASEMADDLTVQSIHMKRFEAECSPRPVLVGELAEVAR